MRIDYLSSDILQFRGDSLAALATAFIDGERVLLVDALASQYDAIAMRDYLETTHRKQVARIILTRPASHDAGVALFPAADVGATEGRLQWGRHRLEVVALGGGALAVDAPDADMLFVGDAVVGNVARLGDGMAQQSDALLALLEARGRALVVPRNLGPVCGKALSNARRYLLRLEEQVLALRSALVPCEAAAAIKRITLEECLPAGELPGALELHWHRDNVRQVLERALFPVAGVPQAAPRRGSVQVCRDTIMSVLTAMLGGLTQRGV